jgi:hypothetical protein
MLRTWKSWAAAAALSLLTAASALAADVSGKWTWTLMFQDNQIMQTLELKQEGEKLTGTITGRNNQKIEIKEGKVTGNDVSFVVIRERNGEEFKSVYKGKLEGTDTIKGNITTNFGGQERTREWTAKKAK